MSQCQTCRCHLHWCCQCQCRLFRSGRSRRRRCCCYRINASFRSASDHLSRFTWPLSQQVLPGSRRQACLGMLESNERVLRNYTNTYGQSGKVQCDRDMLGESFLHTIRGDVSRTCWQRNIVARIACVIPVLLPDMLCHRFLGFLYLGCSSQTEGASCFGCTQQETVFQEKGWKSGRRLVRRFCHPSVEIKNFDLREGEARGEPKIWGRPRALRRVPFTFVTPAYVNLHSTRYADYLASNLSCCFSCLSSILLFAHCYHRRSRAFGNMSVLWLVQVAIRKLWRKQG